MLDAMGLDRQLLEEAKRVRDRLLDLRHQTEQAQSDFEHAVRRLHASGGSLREIAENLGLSHQRVHQIVGMDDAEESPGGGRRAVRLPWHLLVGRGARSGGALERFSGRARDVLVRAQEEAESLGHDFLGTEHLLLALASAPSGSVARALAACRVTPDRVRDGILLLVGRGRGRRRPRRLTPRAKRVLELAVREAGTGEVDECHVLLALMAEGEGIAAKMLDEFGCPRLGDLRRILGDG
jgi:hypothetical protein